MSSKQQTKWLSIILPLLIIFFFPSKAYARFLELDTIINSYRACSWRDNGNGTSTLSVTINFRDAQGHTAGSSFQSRGVLLYSYDKNGRMKSSASLANSVTMNQQRSAGVFEGGNYVIYHGGGFGPSLPEWNMDGAFSANVVVTIWNGVVADWPAISIRAGILTQGNDVGESTGGAYLSRDGTNTNCTVVDPTKPPPVPIAIDMTAPDWALGELQEGTIDKILSSTSEQLCLTYSGSAVSGKNFIINASSLNGVVDNRYRLKNLKDASQLVPYSLTLDSGTSNVSLPNASNKSLPLNSSGKTCFVPTFKTTVDPAVKSGDYSDVLTFTVVTKS